MNGVPGVRTTSDSVGDIGIWLAWNGTMCRSLLDESSISCDKSGVWIGVVWADSVRHITSEGVATQDQFTCTTLCVLWWHLTSSRTDMIQPSLRYIISLHPSFNLLLCDKPSSNLDGTVRLFIGLLNQPVLPFSYDSLHFCRFDLFVHSPLSHTCSILTFTILKVSDTVQL